MTHPPGASRNVGGYIWPFLLIMTDYAKAIGDPRLPTIEVA